MSLGAKIDGQASLLAKLGSLQNVIYPVMSEQLADAAMAVHGEAVKSIASHLSVSHVETRYNPKREQEVSAPGNAPNTDRGTLVQSIKFEIDQAELKAVVGTNLKYGAHLEFGTKDMAARPWLFPAFEAHKEEIRKGFSEAIANAVRGQAK